MKIKYRAKRIDNKEWVYGYIYKHEPPLQCLVSKDYIPEKSKWYILQTAFADWNMPRQVDFIEVDPNTIGQFTGLKDKNGKEIYEGDIFPYRNVITYLADEQEGYGMAAGWYIQRDDFESWSELESGDEFNEVIGNIVDNPELLNR